MENKIGMAKQNGSSVEVYDENGSYLFSRNGELAGFTLNTVAIKEAILFVSMMRMVLINFQDNKKKEKSC